MELIHNHSPDVVLCYILYLIIVRFLLHGLGMLLQDVQHGIMDCQEEHGRLDFIIKEAAVVQFLQDVSCGEVRDLQSSESRLQ